MTRTTKHAKRLALAAALSGVAVAATPALANAASVCTYSPDSLPARVDVFDGSGGSQLTVRRSGQFIAISDGSSASVCASGGHAATVTNTDQILVHGTAQAGEAFPFVIDADALAPGKTPETDGNSEIETIITNNGVPYPILTVKGTSGPDTMRVSAGAGVMLGPDNDVDVRSLDQPRVVELLGLGGNDFLTGRGGPTAGAPGPATTSVEMVGGDGDDFLVGGPLGDVLFGEAGNDTLFAVDGQHDDVSGGDGSDAATIDTVDSAGTVEQINRVTVGRLKLNPTSVHARAGRAAKITVAWQHPESWRQLRSLQLTANDAANIVGAIQIDPGHGRITAHGALQATSRSAVTHHGKWVTARIWLRPSQRLAGRTLRLAVQATDAHDHQQLEPLAGTLTVTK